MMVGSKQPHNFLRVRPKPLDVALWLPLLLASVTLPLLRLSRSASGDITGDFNFATTAAVYVAMSVLAIFYLRRKAIFSRFFQNSDPLVLLFLGVAVLQFIGSGNLSIAVNSAVFLGAALVMRTLGYSYNLRQALFLGSAVLALFILLAYALHGPPAGRWLGGIHPNVFAASCVALVGLSFFGPRWWSDLALFIALAASLGVSSRYAMLVCILLYCLVWSFNIRHMGPLRLLFLIAMPMSLFFDFLIRAEGSVLSNALQLQDAARGLASGISGRDGHWAYFLPQFLEHPLLGYGFRNRAAYIGAHNGFLDICLQMGLIGAAPFFLFWLMRLGRLFKDAAATPKTEFRGRQFALLLGLSLGAQLQPQFINFGDPFGMMVIFCLFSRDNFERHFETLPTGKSLRFKIGNRFHRSIRVS